MISSARTPIPHQIGEDPLLVGSRTRIASAGTATKAIRGRCSSAANKRRRCKVTRVSRARNRPGPVINMLTTPSSRGAASKSSGSLNTDVTLPGIFLPAGSQG